MWLLIGCRASTVGEHISDGINYQVSIFTCLLASCLISHLVSFFLQFLTCRYVRAKSCCSRLFITTGLIAEIEYWHVALRLVLALLAGLAVEDALNSAASLCGEPFESLIGPRCVRLSS